MCSVLKKFRRNQDTVVPQEELFARFEVRDRFLSDCELHCLQLLTDAVGKRAIVCPKPRALEMLRVLDAHQHLDEALRIERKHVDFLVCDLTTGHPLCAVLIDWWDREAESFRPRDQLLARVFDCAGLEVIYVASNRLPTVDQLQQHLEGVLTQKRDVPVSQVHQAHGSVVQSERYGQQKAREPLA